MTLIEPCNSVKLNCVLDPMWETLNPTILRLNDGQPDILFWRVVDTDAKDDPSGVLYNLMNSIISNYGFLATVHFSLPN